MAVKFSIGCNVGFGDSVALVGEHPLLGAWEVGGSLRLTWSPQDVWRGAAELPVGEHEFKVVVIRADKRLEWEAGENRSIVVRRPICRRPGAAA